MPPPAPLEPYLSAKELAEAFRVRNIRPCSYEAMRILIRHCPHSVGFCLRLSDALEFMHPANGFRPRSEKPCQRRQTVVDDSTRGILRL